MLLYKEGEPLKDLSKFLVDGEGKYVEVSLASHQSYILQFSTLSKSQPPYDPLSGISDAAG